MIDKVLIGKAIARLREERGLTQSQLNDLVGMSTIQHIEQGRNSVSLTCLNSIATALDFPAACIVLLGSKIDKGDRVLSSLRSLLESTLSPQNSENIKRKSKDEDSTARINKGAKKNPAIRKKEMTKKHQSVVV